jgi:hypothetical protein
LPFAAALGLLGMSLFRQREPMIAD